MLYYTMYVFAHLAPMLNLIWHCLAHWVKECDANYSGDMFILFALLRSTNTHLRILNYSSPCLALV